MPKCRFCDKIISNAYNLLRHQQDFHKQELSIACEVCDKRFVSHTQRLRHIRQAHKLRCSMRSCSKRFSCQAEIDAHMETDHPLSSRDPSDYSPEQQATVAMDHESAEEDHNDDATAGTTDAAPAVAAAATAAAAAAAAATAVVPQTSSSRHQRQRQQHSHRSRSSVKTEVLEEGGEGDDGLTEETHAHPEHPHSTDAQCPSLSSPMSVSDMCMSPLQQQQQQQLLFQQQQQQMQQMQQQHQHQHQHQKCSSSSSSSSDSLGFDEWELVGGASDTEGGHEHTADAHHMQFTCPAPGCGRMFFDFLERDSHFLQHISLCPSCLAPFGSVEEMEAHAANHASLECTLCNHVFKTTSDLENHKFAAHFGNSVDTKLTLQLEDTNTNWDQLFQSLPLDGIAFDAIQF